MTAFIYGLCACTSGLCAWLLFQAHGQSGQRLLFWSGLFFAITTFNNLFLVFDKLVFPMVDLSVLRYTVSLVALIILLRGLIFEVE